MLKQRPSTAEMKHYSAEEFCADMDAILDEACSFRSKTNDPVYPRQS